MLHIPQVQACCWICPQHHARGGHLGVLAPSSSSEPQPRIWQRFHPKGFKTPPQPRASRSWKSFWGFFFSSRGRVAARGLAKPQIAACGQSGQRANSWGEQAPEAAKSPVGMAGRAPINHTESSDTGQELPDSKCFVGTCCPCPRDQETGCCHVPPA